MTNEHLVCVGGPCAGQRVPLTPELHAAMESVTGSATRWVEVVVTEAASIDYRRPGHPIPEGAVHRYEVTWICNTPLLVPAMGDDWSAMEELVQHYQPKVRP